MSTFDNLDDTFKTDKTKALSSNLKEVREKNNLPAPASTPEKELEDDYQEAREILKTRDLIISIYQDETGKSYDVIKKAIDRDNWMTSEEAKAYGMVDEILLGKNQAR